MLHQLVLMPPVFYSSTACTGSLLVKSPLTVELMPELIAFSIELGSESPETNMDQKQNHKFKVCGAYWVMSSTYIVALIQAILTSSYFDEIAWISEILSNIDKLHNPKRSVKPHHSIQTEHLKLRKNLSTCAAKYFNHHSIRRESRQVAKLWDNQLCMWLFAPKTPHLV